MTDSDSKKIKGIFTLNRKCIVNTDLDGLISGMLLQRYLNWEVVGYSCCNGKSTDNLWLKDPNTKLADCVFVDLPVFLEECTVIDQHFVAFDEESLDGLNKQMNKINPNIMRNRVLRNEYKECDYPAKYPFGTAHFIYAILERQGLVKSTDSLPVRKTFDGFDLADLMLRADRAVGNTCKYTPNCLNWSDWLIDLGGFQTKVLFEILKSEYSQRQAKEANVERKLLSFGCEGKDGDCSNLFRNKDYARLNTYFDFLADAFKFNKLPVFNVTDFNRLTATQHTAYDKDILKSHVSQSNSRVFSYAMTMTNRLSVSYINE